MIRSVTISLFFISSVVLAQTPPSIEAPIDLKIFVDDIGGIWVRYRDVDEKDDHFGLSLIVRVSIKRGSTKERMEAWLGLSNNASRFAYSVHVPNLHKFPYRNGSEPYRALETHAGKQYFVETATNKAAEILSKNFILEAGDLITVEYIARHLTDNQIRSTPYSNSVKIFRDKTKGLLAGSQTCSNYDSNDEKCWF
ncbi:MAG: hypothetical protein JWQ35_342 [Bacteriovoracaceae bacterium]|nr:hypothetical protein [Bacteriovoracaceae bacterium]